jgi:thioredoxin reductase (NADPH)
MAAPVRRILSDDQLDMLARHGEERTAAVGDVLFEVGDETYPFIAIREGEAAILDANGQEIVRHGTAGFLGEMNLLSGQTVFLSAVVTEPMRYVAVDRETLRGLLFEDGVLSDTLLSAFVQRRELLQNREGVGIDIVGPAHDQATRDLIEYARRQRLPHFWRDPEADAEAASLVAELEAEQLPLVRLPGGGHLHAPSNGELSRALGIGLELAEREEVDLLIVGGGPAGLGAAVYGASEGLDTLVVESNVLGGQAGTSRRIENYLGFPSGISGSELISRAIVQARKFTARTATPYRGLALEPGGDGDHVVKLEGGHEVAAKAVLLSTGAEYRKLRVDHLEEYEGLSVFYAAGPPEAQICGAQRVGVVGGGNSAAQAAVWLARGGALVTLLHRRADLAETMSAYLLDELDRYGVAVRDRSEICELRGTDGHLESVKLTDGAELPLSFLFLFLGAAPCTGWLGDSIARDEKGFILTGPDADAEGLLETSVPGVYAAGDVRSGSIKRCATAVGEGATVVRFVHERMEKLREERREAAAGSAAVGAEPGRG